METNTVAQHTPTPWESAFQYIRTGPDSHGNKIVYTLSSLGNLGDFASVKMTFNDTAHIVRCVNAHETLVSTLDSIRAWLVAPDLSQESVEYIRAIVAQALAQVQP